ANFFIQPIYSTSARRVSRYPYHRDIMSNELYWALGPWGTSGSKQFLYWARKLYSFGEGIRFPKADEFWEEAGYAHIVTVPFTADETLLVRAEAKVMLDKYDEATTDLQLWYHSHCAPEYRDSKGVVRQLPELTREKINTFFGSLEYAPVVSMVDGGKDRTIKKKLHPQGFSVSEGEQENFIHCILHFRRLETLFEGQRWIDIKRYGIEVGHNRKNEEAEILKVDDPRRAFQLPIDVIEAGIEANPR
ncbi:RagB/SusD family nutrient uptake outer membrane protein, partial [Bacteroides heparinolyticus]